MRLITRNPEPGTSSLPLNFARCGCYALEKSGLRDNPCNGQQGPRDGPDDKPDPISGLARSVDLIEVAEHSGCQHESDMDDCESDKEQQNRVVDGARHSFGQGTGEPSTGGPGGRESQAGEDRQWCRDKDHRGVEDLL